jgi:hypothetical protein
LQLNGRVPNTALKHVTRMGKGPAQGLGLADYMGTRAATAIDMLSRASNGTMVRRLAGLGRGCMASLANVDGSKNLADRQHF